MLPSELRIIESGSQGNSESFKKDNSCLAAEILGSVKPERSPEESGDEDRAALNQGVSSSTSQWASLKSTLLQGNTAVKMFLSPLEIK